MIRLVFALGGASWASGASAQSAEAVHAIAGATDTFLGQGILGAVIVVLGLVVAFLYWDCRTLRTQIGDLAERRTTDVAALAKETATGLAKSSGTMATLMEEVAALSNKVQSSIDVARLQPAALEAVVKQGQEVIRDLDRNLIAIERVRDIVSSGGGGR